MIQRFIKNTNEETTYHNAVELAWLFVVSEIIEYLIVFKAFDSNTREYNYRRVFWVVLLSAMSVAFISLIGITCVMNIMNLFGVI